MIKPNGTIQTLQLLTKRPVAKWWTTTPFVFLYAIFFAIFLQPTLVWSKATYLIWMKYIDFAHAVSVPIVMFFHAFFSLLAVWSVKHKARCLFYKTDKVSEATHLLIVAKPHKGESSVVEMQRAKDKEGNACTFFVFQQRRWTYDEATKLFCKPLFPTKLPFTDYLQAKGQQNSSAVESQQEQFGMNKITVFVPEFLTLLVDHAFAPFFVFQMFCVLLWCLDEYWYYSIFTGIMMIFLECTVCMQRLNNMKNLRQMGEVPPCKIRALRGGKFVDMTSDQLCPMDVVELPTNSPVPADIVIISGTCVVNEAILTGESTPQLKESLQVQRHQHAHDKAQKDPAKADQQQQQCLAVKQHARHIAFSGTQLLLSTPSSDNSSSPAFRTAKGAIGVVIKTGFETKQGKLVRTILHSQSRVSENSGEAFVFIAFLLVFALVASYYVLRRGLADPTRSRWKLFLTCTQIITSVVPPELPMELSLAVNTSLLALMNLRVFCTEPFRIPFGGKVDTCCFDKTGTLTTDEMLFAGILLCDGRPMRAKIEEIPRDAEQVLCGCHSLVSLEAGEIAGDAMEKAAVETLKWKCGKSGDQMIKEKKVGGGGSGGGRGGSRVQKEILNIVNRFAFDPQLRRMTCVAQDESSDYWIVSKGSPESIQGILEFVPKSYTETYMKCASQGHRVIALARRRVPPENSTRSYVEDLSRDEVEQRLQFAGFAIYQCPLKLDTPATIKELLDSNHHCSIITGDSIQTAVAVARQVHIIAPEASGAHDPAAICDEDGEFKSVKKKYLPSKSLCVNAEVLDPTAFQRVLKQHGTSVVVWARCTPAQKEDIVAHLKHCGRVVLMAGDGTNDVGALKQAEVGVAVLNSMSVANNASKSAEEIQEQQQQSPTATASGDKDNKSGDASTSSSSPKAEPQLPPPPPESAGFMERMRYELQVAKLKAQQIHKDKLDKARDKSRAENAAAAAAPGAEDMESLMSSAFNDMDDMGMAPQIKLGDASIAAPFTCKSKKMMSICEIVKMGRCTLVTTIQMYKILALNCLNSAYAMSVLHSDGVKFGDKQMMISGIIVAICFLFLSRAKPAKKLSKERPITRVFHPYNIVSILGQFGVHLYSLIRSVNLVQEVDPHAIATQRGERDVIEFRPTLLNSIVFLVTTMMTVSIFAVNYKGRPFMTGLTENKPLLIGLIVLAAVVFGLASEADKELNDLFEMVPLPSEEFRNELLMILALDGMWSLAVEKTSFLLLGWIA